MLQHDVHQHHLQIGTLRVDQEERVQFIFTTLEHLER
jgi:hypothetical protein